MTEIPNAALAKSVLKSMIDREKVLVMIIPEIGIDENGKQFWTSDGNVRIHSVGIKYEDGNIIRLLRNLADHIEQMNEREEGDGSEK